MRRTCDGDHLGLRMHRPPPPFASRSLPPASPTPTSPPILPKPPTKAATPRLIMPPHAPRKQLLPSQRARRGVALFSVLSALALAPPRRRPAAPHYSRFALSRFAAARVRDSEGGVRRWVVVCSARRAGLLRASLYLSLASLAHLIRALLLACTAGWIWLRQARFRASCGTCQIRLPPPIVAPERG